MANGHGGRRPGAGRKKSETRLSQEAARDLFNAVFTDDDVAGIARVVRDLALSGSVPHINIFTAYRLGKPPEQIEMSGPDGDPLEIVIRRGA